jgi:hypothetical protein
MSTKKIFHSFIVTKPELRKVICQLARKLGVKKVVFNKKAKKVRGTYNAFNNVMYIDSKQSKRNILLTFFHEMGHHKAVRQNKWRKYHLCLVPSMKIETMFNIENKIDQIGRKLWNKYVNPKQWGRYKYVYPKTQKRNLMKQMTTI